jgi:hypothetical protein
LTDTTKGGSSQIYFHKQRRGQEQKPTEGRIHSINEIQSMSGNQPTPKVDDEVEKQLVNIARGTKNFTLLLVIVGALQVGASSFAYCAARNSVKVAVLALMADRPYLVVDSISPARVLEEIEDAPIIPELILKNCGKRPAIIQNIKAHLTTIPTKDALPAIGDFSACSEIEIRRTVISPAEEEAYFRPVKMAFRPAQGDDEAFRQRVKFLVIYGQIKYHDV